MLRTVRPRVKTACGYIYVGISYDDETDRLAQISLQLGKNGQCQHCMLEAISRIANIGLDHGVPPALIARHLKEFYCEKPFFSNKYQKQFTSCLDVAAFLVEEYLTAQTPQDALQAPETNDNPKDEE